MKVRKYSTADALAAGAAERFVRLAAAAMVERRRFTVALSGGSTPRSLYELLAMPSYVQRIDWKSVHIFWGDERCVPPDDKDSNFRMANDVLLTNVPIPHESVHRIRGEIDPPEAAREYERTLRELLRDEPLDLALLGMGHDGHTASLFPGTEAVLKELSGTQDRWVVANHVEHLDAWRVTLTTIPINASRHVLVLVSGTRKAPALQQIFAGRNSRDPLPVELINPVNGDLRWLIDKEAAEGVALPSPEG